MKNETKQYILIGIVLAIFGVMLLMEPVPQDLVYHSFVDTRPLFGIQNALNVLSNIPFLLVGILGLIYLKKYPPVETVWSWYVFFIGIILVAPGSALYHFLPNNSTLVWDRLPMTLGFMGLFTALMDSYVLGRIEKVMLPVALFLGLASVVYWAIFDDLRFYIFVQVIPLILILLTVFMFKSKEVKAKYIIGALLFYVLAKFCEANDETVYKLSGELFSGHTLKHIMAAVAPVLIAIMFRVNYMENEV